MKRMRIAKKDARLFSRLNPGVDLPGATANDLDLAGGGRNGMMTSSSPPRGKTPRGPTPRRSVSAARRAHTNHSGSRGSSSPGAGHMHAFLKEALERLYEGLQSKSEALLTFQRIDKDNSGSLDAREFKLALKYLGLHLNERQIGYVVQHIDDDGDGEVSIEEFMRIVFDGKLARLRKRFQVAAYSNGSLDTAAFERLFRHYDRCNSGELSFDDFRRAARKDMQVPAKTVPDSELREMFEIVDTDGGGTISKDEFLELMTADENDEESLARQRNASTAGQMLHRILEHAAEKHANLMYASSAHASKVGCSVVCLVVSIPYTMMAHHDGTTGFELLIAGLRS